MYKAVKMIAGKGFSKPVSLDGTSPDIWINHFKNILGQEHKPETKGTEALRLQRAWKICEEELTTGEDELTKLFYDNEYHLQFHYRRKTSLTNEFLMTNKIKYQGRSKKWDINLKPPTETEVKTAIDTTKKNRAVAQILPTELFSNSPQLTKILTQIITKIWKGEEIPKDWLRATMCLLYKKRK